MYRESAGRLFARYALPQMVGLMFNSVYFIVDGVFIGHRLGGDALAAAGVAVPLLEFMIALALALAAGAGVVISGHLARGQASEARRAFTASTALTGGVGLAIAALGVVFLHPLARFLGATEEIMPLATSYIRYIVALAPFQLYSFLLGGLARNDGKPRLAMAAMAVGSLSNILLDWLFMYPLNMGIGGAALATAVGPAISVFILLPHFLLGKGALRFERSAGFSFVPAFLRLGFPSFIMEFTVGMVAFFYNYGIVRYGYGETGLAAYLIIGYLSLILLTLFLGMAEGLQPVFSFLFFAGDSAKLRRLTRMSQVIFLSTGLVSYALAAVGSGAFYRLFTPGQDALRRFAADVSRYYFAGFFAAGFNILMISRYQSAGQTGRAMVISLLRSLVLPPLLILTLPLLNPSFLWLCHALGEVGAMAAALALGARKKQTHGEKAYENNFL